jgi:2'-5' RNA ligase
MVEDVSRSRLRLFVAVTLPEQVKTAIEQTQAELRRALPGPAFRWTKRDQFHLTLKFLGYVEQTHVDALVSALQTACRPFPALPLRAERLGFFPGGSRPRVLWVGIHDAKDLLISLQQAIEAAVAPFTEEKPENRFKGHITLARLKDIQRADTETLKNVAASMQNRFFGDWTARAVELIQSTLSPTGARYTSLASAPLS